VDFLGFLAFCGINDVVLQEVLLVYGILSGRRSELKTGVVICKTCALKLSEDTGGHEVDL